MEIDDDSASTTHATLDGVSTCLDEVNELLDPNFRTTVEHFFKVKKQQDYNSAPLPIESKRKNITTQINLNRVVIIKGTTGCGKTTQVPQFIMEDCYNRNKHFNIVVTQPRRIAAKSIAERVCEERDWKVGELVGYQIGMDKTAGELTRLLYCTTGVLLQKLIAEKKMDNYTHIIIDEIHERSDETDLLLMVVRKFLWTQAAPVKVILMSATFDSNKFVHYFSLKSQSGLPIRPYEVKIEESVRPIIKTYINGFPPTWRQEASVGVEQPEFLQFDIEDPHIDAVRARMCPIMIKHFDSLDRSASRKGAVLVFLPGFDDIRQMTKLLEAYSSKFRLNWLILQLHSSITLEEQRKVFVATKLGERKIILSTNIAESSITVPEVVYVIDYCLTKSLVCDKMTNYPTLKLEWASHANCDQRAGRCGRVQDGRVYRMVTAEFYDRFMSKEGVPELLRTPLENAILKVKKLDLGPPRELLALCIDSPNLGDLRRSIVRLKRVGALTPTINGVYEEEDGQLSLLGKMMADLPLDVQLSKFVMMGYLFDCLDDCIIIAACLSLQNFFSKSFDDTIRAYKARLAWTERTFSDPIAYWYAYRTFWDMVSAGIFESRSAKAKTWCRVNFIQYARLQDVINLVDELRKRLTSAGIQSEKRPNLIRDKFEDQLILKVVIAAAFYPYYYIKTPLRNPEIAKELTDKDPYKTVKLSGLPQHEGVLYADQIKLALEEIDSHMELEFEDTHCYVTFHTKDDEILGPAISSQTDGMAVPRAEESLYQESMLRKKVFQENQVATAVYLAIKLNRCRKQIIVTKYKPHIAGPRIKSLFDIREAKINAAHLFRTARYRIPPYSSCKIPNPRLPSKSKKKIEITVTEVEPEFFYARMRDRQTTTMLANLDKAIENAYKPEKFPYNDPKVGDVIIINWKYEDRPRKLERARVCRVDRERKSFEVFCIDSGTTGIINLEDLDSCVRLDPTQMPVELFSTPALAMACRLCEVTPSQARKMKQEARYNDLDVFASLVLNCNDVWGMVYSVVNDVIALKLFRGQDNGVSINDKLLADGVFVKWDEPSQSKFDSNVRFHHRATEEEEPLYTLTEACTVENFIPEGEAKYLADSLINSYNSPFSKEKVKLKGPYTPIEVSFEGVTRQDSVLRVAIDSESVNSVCFDPDPENSNKRLLVASCVQLQPESGRLTARNTTLMPDITGFPQLMSLLFAPRVEFRVDYERKQYVSALCGLGYDENTKHPHDPDNDMEITFDCFIDNADITKINLIRYNISDVLSSESNFAEICGHALFQKQQKIRAMVLELLSRQRVVIPIKEKWERKFEWVDKDQLTSSNVNLLIEPLYETHKVVAEVCFENFKENLATNLESMKLIIDS